MQDTALYQYLLGLQLPWIMRRVNLCMSQGSAWTYGPNTWRTRHGRTSPTCEHT